MEARNLCAFRKSSSVDLPQRRLRGKNVNFATNSKRRRATLTMAEVHTAKMALHMLRALFSTKGARRTFCTGCNEGIKMGAPYGIRIDFSSKNPTQDQFSENMNRTIPDG
jgi:hypothetical protein